MLLEEAGGWPAAEMSDCCKPTVAASWSMPGEGAGLCQASQSAVRRSSVGTGPLACQLPPAPSEAFVFISFLLVPLFARNS